MQLHHLAHLSEKHVRDHRFEAMQRMKAEAHSLVMSEDPKHVVEADVLSIGGTRTTPLCSTHASYYSTAYCVGTRARRETHCPVVSVACAVRCLALGLPRSFFKGCKDEVAQGEKIAELVYPFGFVMASTADVVDQVFGNNCKGLAKFAMPCSVVSRSAYDDGLSQQQDRTLPAR